MAIACPYHCVNKNHNKKFTKADNKVCDPFLSIEHIDEEEIEEIINITTNKRIAKAQRKCAVRLRNRTELT